MVRNFDKENSLHPDMYIFLTLLFIASICISPLIYGIMNKSIRKQIRSMFSGGDLDRHVTGMKDANLTPIISNQKIRKARYSRETVELKQLKQLARNDV